MGNLIQKLGEICCKDKEAAFTLKYYPQALKEILLAVAEEIEELYSIDEETKKQWANPQNQEWLGEDSLILDIAEHFRVLAETLKTEER